MSHTSLTRIAYGICIISFASLLSGCGGSAGQAGSAAKPQTSKHPHLKFHKPKSLPAAVQRLADIQEAVNGEGDLPAPRTFEYVEVIHGQGPSAHSHFYMADNYDSAMVHHEENEHDEEEHETVERHTKKIDCRTEFADIASWLPDIAAASDMDSAGWQSVSDTSKKITGVLETIPEGLPDNKFRDAWRQKAKEIGSGLNVLQELLKSTTGAHK